MEWKENKEDLISDNDSSATLNLKSDTNMDAMKHVDDIWHLRQHMRKLTDNSHNKTATAITLIIDEKMEQICKIK
jgi:hypothetical protein